MPLINMKLTPKEAKIEAGIEEPKGPDYPYGLEISLDEEAISKLGIKELPKDGSAMSVIANANVIETGDVSRQGKKHRRLRLQITDMSLEDKIKPDKLKTLYSDESKK
ncbi:hypothetical protein KAR91_87420 [Candidatus Pacearchaeota archaeon]|nr:hypothetical protein [Candidatus Pacearchaeota archaeon]